MIKNIRQHIIAHPTNRELTQAGYLPLFSASPAAKIVIIGQAPGRKAQTSGLVWNDASGQRLIRWLGVDEETFRDPQVFAHLPMDFYYPGKGTSGDLPPRRDFAALWHPQILADMPQVQLTVLIGNYAQKYYLGTQRAVNLTETVRNFKTYLPNFFPIVHPSPLNFRWHANNPWYEREVVTSLQQHISNIIT